MAYSILVDKEHQGKGIGGILTLIAVNDAWKNEMRYNATPVESSAFRSISICKKFGLKIKRSYLILEYKI